jgi:hypothetical protein
MATATRASAPPSNPEDGMSRLGRDRTGVV